MKEFYKINVVNKNTETASHSPRVRRKRRAKQDAILAAAMHLLADGGLEAVTVQRLARELDLTAGALYRYFPGKDALLAAMQRQAVATLRGRYQAFVAERRDDWADRDIAAPIAELMALLSLAEFYVGLAQTLPHEIKLITFMLADPRHLINDEEAARLVPEFFGLLREVTQLFGAAAASGALDDGDGLERSLVLWSGLQGILQLDKLQRFDARVFQIHRLGRQLAQTLLSGWGAKPEQLGEAVAAIDEE